VVLAVIVVAAVVFVPIVFFAGGYNIYGPWADARRLERNDRMFLDHYCARGGLTRFHRLNRRLPATPRCKLCYVPFGGLGRLFLVRPSRKNPNFCRSCFESAPVGGYETSVGILFADARGFTAWAEHRSPSEVAAALNRFYKSATDALMAHDAIIDKFVGDEVMAIFIADIPTLGSRTCDEMLAAAQQLMLAAEGAFGELPIGVGLHYGEAWIGNVGDTDTKDFTALGDVVNVAARLQAQARGGEVLISEEVAGRLGERPAGVTTRDLVLKGRHDPLTVHVVGG
jgi:adenylate cyclase